MTLFQPVGITLPAVRAKTVEKVAEK